MSSLFLLGAVTAFIAAIFMNPVNGVLVYFWLSLMNPQTMVYGLAAAAPLTFTVAVASFAAFFLSKERKMPAVSAIAVLIFLFMIWITVTTVFGLASDRYAKWWLVTRIYIMALLALTLITTKVRLHAMAWIFAIAIGIWGVKGGLFSILSGGTARIWGPEETMIADNNSLAVAELTVIPILNYLRLNSDNRYIKLGLAGAMALCMISVLCSYSRGAAIGLAAMALFLWFKSKRKLLFGGAMLVVVAGGLAFMPQKWYHRVSTIENYEEDRSATDRLDMWWTATRLAMARPLVGAGFRGPYHREVVDRFDPSLRARAVHSIYFEVIGEHGFVGFLIWALVPVFMWRACSSTIRLTRTLRDMQWANDLARMLQVALIAYLTGGAFLSMSYWDGYWLLVVITAAMRHIVAVQLQGARPLIGAPALATVPV